MNGEETRAAAEQSIASADEQWAELDAMRRTPTPITRMLMMAAAGMRSAVLRVVWHMGDVIDRLDALRSESTARSAAAALQLGTMGEQTAQGLGLVADRLQSALLSLAAIDADIIALSPLPTPPPLAGTLAGVALNAAQVLAPSGGTVERVVLTNTGGGAVELEVRLGATRVDRVRLAANERATVGPLRLSAVLYLVPISGTAPNLAATLWSVVYR